MAGVLLQRVTEVYESWNRGDFDAATPYLHPEVEWHNGGLFPELDPVEHGVEGVRRWWRVMNEPWESFHVEVEQSHELGSTVVTWIAFEALASASGVEVDVRFAHVFDFDGGQIRRYRSFVCLDEALETALGGRTR